MGVGWAAACARLRSPVLARVGVRGASCLDAQRLVVSAQRRTNAPAERCSPCGACETGSEGRAGRCVLPQCVHPLSALLTSCIALTAPCCTASLTFQQPQRHVAPSSALSLSLPLGATLLFSRRCACASSLSLCRARGTRACRDCAAGVWPTPCNPGRPDAPRGTGPAHGRSRNRASPPLYSHNKSTDTPGPPQAAGSLQHF